MKKDNEVRSTIFGLSCGEGMGMESEVRGYGGIVRSRDAWEYSFKTQIALKKNNTDG